METLLLSRSDIERVITMKDAVDAVERTFRGIAEGTVVNPTKTVLDLGETAPFPACRGFVNAMPAYVGWLDSAGLKWVGAFQENPSRGLPFITAMILLVDPQTGQFLAVLDGTLITALRTGAQSAVPLKWLHDGPTVRLGLYGAGVQARTQTLAIAEVFPIEALTVYDIRREAAEEFAREMAPVVKGPIVVAESPETAADGQVIICATQGKSKFLKEAWVKSGTTVIPMGSYQECEDDLLLRADKIVVDHVEHCLHRGALRDVVAAGKIAERQLHATIGEVVAGKRPGRTSPTERIVCIPLGLGAHDIAVATVAYRRALERGLGEKFSFA